MRSKIGMLVLMAVVATGSSALGARDEYDDSQSHPLRVAGYLLHPVGFALEWALFRPLHWVVSRNDGTETVFGHTSHGSHEIVETPDTSPTLRR